MSIAQAIQSQHLLTFSYDGYPRTVEPHTYGIDRKGHRALRAYQVGGGSESGEYVGWKLFHADEMSGLTMQSQTFSGPRPGYKRSDQAFAQIQAQL
jgi:predicted DNA-binding transcriptional regulator YafY